MHRNVQKKRNLCSFNQRKFKLKFELKFKIWIKINYEIKLQTSCYGNTNGNVVSEKVTFGLGLNILITIQWQDLQIRRISYFWASCRSFILNKTTFTEYCLTQRILRPPESFEIRWVRQYLVNFTVLVAIPNHFYRSRAFRTFVISNTESIHCLGVIGWSCEGNVAN